MISMNRPKMESRPYEFLLHSVHGISGILEWVAIYFFKGIFPVQGSNPNHLQIGRGFFTTGPSGKPPLKLYPALKSCVIMNMLQNSMSEPWLLYLEMEGNTHPLVGVLLQ